MIDDSEGLCYVQQGAQVFGCRPETDCTRRYLASLFFQDETLRIADKTVRFLLRMFSAPYWHCLDIVRPRWGGFQEEWPSIQEAREHCMPQGC